MSEVIGAIWIVLGSMLFFGAIVATITAYFMHPLLRSGKVWEVQFVSDFEFPTQ